MRNDNYIVEDETSCYGQCVSKNDRKSNNNFHKHNLVYHFSYVVMS
jgi:hypothetical protein